MLGKIALALFIIALKNPFLEGRRFSAPVTGGAVCAATEIDSSAYPLLKGRDCASSCPFSLVKVTHTEEEWRHLLGEKRYAVMRQKGTEKGFLGKYVYHGERGIYKCAACSLPLFDSKDKYDSGAGWPCFTRPIDPKQVYYLEDWSLSFKRYEVLCRQCDSHLGHVFHDGPPPQHLRYCINSIALEFSRGRLQILDGDL